MTEDISRNYAASVTRRFAFDFGPWRLRVVKGAVTHGAVTLIGSPWRSEHLSASRQFMKSLRVRLQRYLRHKSRFIPRMLSDSLDKQLRPRSPVVKGRDTPTPRTRPQVGKKLDGILASGRAFARDTALLFLNNVATARGDVPSARLSITSNGGRGGGRGEGERQGCGRKLARVGAISVLHQRNGVSGSAGGGSD